jgi:hypothetical protein
VPQLLGVFIALDLDKIRSLFLEVTWQPRVHSEALIWKLNFQTLVHSRLSHIQPSELLLAVQIGSANQRSFRKFDCSKYRSGVSVLKPFFPSVHLPSTTFNNFIRLVPQVENFGPISWRLFTSPKSFNLVGLKPQIWILILPDCSHM